MDYKAIEHLIKTTSETGITHFEMQAEGISIAINNGNYEGTSDYKADEFDKEKRVIVDDRKDLKLEESIDESNLNIVNSPLVGTFYASSDPNSEAFVKVGDKVKKGDTLCIIEAMKLMNEIKSEVDGEVVEILAEDEQMVEYGQKLFKIK